MIPACPRCQIELSIDPKGITLNNDFLLDFKCKTHGLVRVSPALTAKMNWDAEYVNKEQYPTYDLYLSHMIELCTKSCFGCKFSNLCYTSSFYYDINKSLLHKEIEG